MERKRIASILTLSFAHFSCDGFLNFIPPLWPVIKTIYGLSNTEVGLLTALLSTTANFGQLIFGYLTDRLRPSGLVLTGVLMTSVFISTIGFAPSSVGLMLFLLMAGVGIALFHPRAAALATGLARGEGAFGLSLFGGGGTLGYALGSLIGVSLYQHFNTLKGLFPSLAFGLGVAVTVLILNPEGAEEKAEMDFILRRHLLPRISRIGPLFAVISLRAAAVTAFVNFMPILLRSRGASLSAGGGAVFLFVSGSAVGSIIGGKLAVRMSERFLTVITLLLSSPLLLASVLTRGIPLFASLFMAGFMLRCADYVNIARTQAIVPEGASLVAALGMGGAWGIAGLIAPVVGKTADLYGESIALAWSAGLPIAAALIASTVRFNRGHHTVWSAPCP